MKDAEFVSETVVINRLYHRELIARMNEIDELEKKWNCKIDFPSTEMASDVVTISGPEYQVPQAVDEFLVRTVYVLLYHSEMLTLGRAWYRRAMRLSFLQPLSFENSSSQTTSKQKSNKSSRANTKSTCSCAMNQNPPKSRRQAKKEFYLLTLATTLAV